MSAKYTYVDQSTSARLGITDTTFFGYLRVTDIFRQAFAESPFSWPRSQPLPDDLSEDDRTVSSYRDLLPVD